MSETVPSDILPPCDCIELVGGQYTYRCVCTNRDDGERAAAWCVDANHKSAAEYDKATIEFLRKEAAEAADEITKLRAALRNALERGVFTQYWGDDDECGTHSCCGIESYKPHDAECWTVKARAALGGGDD